MLSDVDGCDSETVRVRPSSVSIGQVYFFQWGLQVEMRRVIGAENLDEQGYV